ncbi:uncharacterized protein LOC100882741 [Megachile rotundata]|uniref:uncharacterized protein LOC100882741 n=1 Tax=Megachile rotundata TaxID=143995 RepID=UPI003FD1907E
MINCMLTHTLHKAIVTRYLITGLKSTFHETDSVSVAYANSSQTEPLSKAVGLFDDAVSMRSLLHKLFDKLNENLSFCALQDGTSELVGVLIASIFDKTQWELALKLPGEGLRHITMLRNYVMAKAMFYETVDSNNLVRIDIFCVKLDHQKKGIGTALLRSCLTRASAFANAFVGEFTSGASQTVARRLNFEVISELPYENIGSDIHKFHIFEECYPQNYSIACMAAKITLPLQYHPSIMSVSVRKLQSKTKTSKQTRKKK